MKPKTVYAALAATAFLTAAPDLVATDLPRQPAAAETLGRVDFPVSCTPEAQRRFNRAMQLYHNFYFPAARKAFDAVLEADPACAMAEWGIALSRWSNPFAANIRPAAPLLQGREAVTRARALGADRTDGQ